MAMTEVDYYTQDVPSTDQVEVYETSDHDGEFDDYEVYYTKNPDLQAANDDGDLETDKNAVIEEEAKVSYIDSFNLFEQKFGGFSSDNTHTIPYDEAGGDGVVATKSARHDKIRKIKELLRELDLEENKDNDNDDKREVVGIRRQVEKLTQENDTFIENWRHELKQHLSSDIGDFCASQINRFDTRSGNGNNGGDSGGIVLEVSNRLTRLEKIIGNIPSIGSLEDSNLVEYGNSANDGDADQGAKVKSIQLIVNDLNRKINLILNPELSLEKVKEDINVLVNKSNEYLRVSKRFNEESGNGVDEITKIEKIYSKIGVLDPYTIELILQKLKSYDEIIRDCELSSRLLMDLNEEQEKLSLGLDKWETRLSSLETQLIRESDKFEKNKIEINKWIDSLI